MVKVYQRYIHFFSSSAEVVMVKRAHASAAITSSLPEILLLRELEGSLEKQFLILVRSLIGQMHALSDCFHCQSFLLAQLLHLYIAQRIVVEHSAQNDVEVSRIRSHGRVVLRREGGLMLQ